MKYLFLSLLILSACSTPQKPIGHRIDDTSQSLVYEGQRVTVTSGVWRGCVGRIFVSHEAPIEGFDNCYSVWLSQCPKEDRIDFSYNLPSPVEQICSNDLTFVLTKDGCNASGCK